MAGRRSGADRATAYDLSVLPDNVRAKFDSRKADMVRKQQDAQGMLVSEESKVHEILDANGVVGVLRVPYLNVARALIRAKGHNSGAAMNTICDAERAKGLALGLDAGILDQVIDAIWPQWPGY